MLRSPKIISNRYHVEVWDGQQFCSTSVLTQPFSIRRNWYQIDQQPVSREAVGQQRLDYSHAGNCKAIENLCISSSLRIRVDDKLWRLSEESAHISRNRPSSSYLCTHEIHNMRASQVPNFMRIPNRDIEVRLRSLLNANAGLRIPPQGSRLSRLYRRWHSRASRRLNVIAQIDRI